MSLLRRVQDLRNHSIFVRRVGFLSCVVGLLCYALSSSFKSLFGEWNPTKIVLYIILSSIISVVVLFEAKNRVPVVTKLKPHVEFLVLMLTSLYSFFSDSSTKGKPDAWSVVSSGAFALTSLCLSLQIEPGFDVGLFSFFLGWVTVQLMKIHLIFILVAAVICYPLLVLGSYSESPSENGDSIPEERVEILIGDGNTVHVTAGPTNMRRRVTNISPSPSPSPSPLPSTDLTQDDDKATEIFMSDLQEQVAAHDKFMSGLREKRWQPPEQHQEQPPEQEEQPWQLLQVHQEGPQEALQLEKKWQLKEKQQLRQLIQEQPPPPPPQWQQEQPPEQLPQQTPQQPWQPLQLRLSQAEQALQKPPPQPPPQQHQEQPPEQQVQPWQLLQVHQEGPRKALQLEEKRHLLQLKEKQQLIQEQPPPKQQQEQPPQQQTQPWQPLQLLEEGPLPHERELRLSQAELALQKPLPPPQLHQEQPPEQQEQPWQLLQVYQGGPREAQLLEKKRQLLQRQEKQQLRQLQQLMQKFLPPQHQEQPLQHQEHRPQKLRQRPQPRSRR